MKCGVCKQVGDAIGIAHVKSCISPVMPRNHVRIATIEDVERLLGQPAPQFDLLLDGIAVAKRERRLDLRDRCIQYAIASVTGEVPEREVRNLALEAAVRFMEEASETSLHGELVKAADALRKYASTSSPRIAAALTKERESLDYVALCLGRSTAPALTSAASRLRHFKRPDLAYVLSSKAADMDRDSAPALTSMAAAFGRSGSR